MLLTLLLSLCLGPPVRLFDDADYVFPRVSPDGSSVAVARVYDRPDGAETTDLVLIDTATGKRTELLSRKEAQRYEVYEVYVVGLYWLDANRVVVELGDGDVGGNVLVIDTRTRRIGKTYPVDDEEPFPFVLPSGRTVIRQSNYDGANPRITVASPKRVIAHLAQAEGLQDVLERGDGLLLLTDAQDGDVTVRRYHAGRLSIVSHWHKPELDTCLTLRAAADRLYLFAHTCDRAKPSSSTLYDITDGTLTRCDIGKDVDELSTSADGTRTALSRWRDGKRVLELHDCRR